MIALDGKKVVLVEDDVWLAELFERQLKSAGMQVWRSTYPASALEQIDEVKPDIVVADLLLTGSTGLVLFHEMQSHADLSQLPIVVVSSIADSIPLDKLKSYGVTKVVNKLTMEPDDLLSAIRGALS